MPEKNRREIPIAKSGIVFMTVFGSKGGASSLLEPREPKPTRKSEIRSTYRTLKGRFLYKLLSKEGR